MGLESPACAMKLRTFCASCSERGAAAAWDAAWCAATGSGVCTAAPGPAATGCSQSKTCAAGTTRSVSCPCCGHGGKSFLSSIHYASCCMVQSHHAMQHHSLEHDTLHSLVSPDPCLKAWAECIQSCACIWEFSPKAVCDWGSMETLQQPHLAGRRRADPGRVGHAAADAAEQRLRGVGAPSRVCRIRRCAGGGARCRRGPLQDALVLPAGRQLLLGAGLRLRDGRRCCCRWARSCCLGGGCTSTCANRASAHHILSTRSSGHPLAANAASTIAFG